MANEVAVIEDRKSILRDMAERYGFDTDVFERVVRSTCCPVDKDGFEPNREEFAAFMLVCKEHRLNPLTKEIYAMRRKKGGGYQAVVGVDGWLRIINEHPQFDGAEFEEQFDDKGNIVSVKASIYRKDRAHPMTVTEYLSECKQDTDAWKNKAIRMLRHKAMIQGARYAFGFAGIVEPDEAREFTVPAEDLRPDGPLTKEVRPRDMTPRREKRAAEAAKTASIIPVSQPAFEGALTSDPSKYVADLPVDETPSEDADTDGIIKLDVLLDDLDKRLGECGTVESVEEAYTEYDAEALLTGYQDGVEAGRAVKATHLARIGERRPAASQSQGNGIAEPQYGPEDDPFRYAVKGVSALPPRFSSIGEYAAWVKMKVMETDSLEKCADLSKDWNATKQARQDLGMDDDSIIILRDMVKEHIGSFKTPEPQITSGRDPWLPNGNMGPLEAYEGFFSRAPTAADKATAEKMKKAWFQTADYRDEIKLPMDVRKTLKDLVLGKAREYGV